MDTKIPPLTKFSSKELYIPPLKRDFQSIYGNVSCAVNSLLPGACTWVNQGDPIAVYKITKPNLNLPVLHWMAGNKKIYTYIRSPVSGLLTGTYYGGGLSNLLILLPEGEVVTEGIGEYLFRDVCDAFRLHSDSCNTKHSYPHTEDSLNKLIDCQAQEVCEINIANERAEYYQEVLLEKPYLENYIGHLA